MKGGKGRRRERGREVEKRRTKGGKVGKMGREGAEERIERGRERQREGGRDDGHAQFLRRGYWLCPCSTLLSLGVVTQSCVCKHCLLLMT